MAKGSRWSSEIAKELDASRVGILVITPENQESSWLLFEAGALAKNLERSKVCPLLFGGMEPTDVKGPLVQFQAAGFSKDEMKRLMKMINGELGETGLAPDVIDTVFEMWWPRLEKEVAEQLEDLKGNSEGERRSERDLLEEVLSLTRRLASDRSSVIDSAHPAWDDLFTSVTELARLAFRRSPDGETSNAIQGCLRPLSYIAAHRDGRPSRSRFRESTRRALDELQDMTRSDIGTSVNEQSAKSDL